MSQVTACALAWFVSVMKLVTTNVENIRMNLYDATGSDDCPVYHAGTLSTFSVRLSLHKLKLSLDKSKIGVSGVDFLGHAISADSVCPNNDKAATL